jgi:hypothetical protein
VSGANVWATTQGNSAVAASTTSAADGSFHLALSPGVYDLHAQAGMSCRPQTITVQAGQISSIDINCDSGIR